MKVRDVNLTMKNRGVEFNDRVLAGEVRSLALEKVKAILIKGEKHKLFGAVIIRLAGTILPRLAELTGENGGPLVVEISGVVAKKNATHSGTGANS